MAKTATTNSTPKLTKVDKFKMLQAVPAVASDPVLSEFVAHELELLVKKNSAEKKPTAQQTANVGIQTAILSAMQAEPNRLFTITEILKAVPACAELTNQRVSALMRQLKDEGKVIRTEDKRKAYFQFAEV